MKKIGFLLLLAIGLFACQTSDKKTTAAPANYSATGDSTSFTSIAWLDSTEINLGKAAEGQIVEVAFRFKNTGDNNLVIENVQAGCGCTVADKPEKPFAPGEEGVIKAKFDSKGKPGENRKNISVTANTSQRDYMLYFTIDVTPLSK